MEISLSLLYFIYKNHFLRIEISNYSIGFHSEYKSTLFSNGVAYSLNSIIKFKKCFIFLLFDLHYPSAFQYTFYYINSLKKNYTDVGNKY